MKQLIIPDKVQKEMLTDFMILGETRGLIGGYCENEFPVCYANEEMARMLGYDAVEAFRCTVVMVNSLEWVLDSPAVF